MLVILFNYINFIKNNIIYNKDCRLVFYIFAVLDLLIIMNEDKN